jgi:hypothetical protein
VGVEAGAVERAAVPAPERTTDQVSKQATASTPAPLVELPITCMVPDTAVVIDNRAALQVSGASLVSAPAGTHVVRFRRLGYAETVRTVEFTPGATVSIDCALRRLADLPESLSATLKVDLADAQGSARLDGDPLPREALVPIGRHRLQIMRVGFEPWVQELTLAPREIRTISPQLEPYVAPWTPRDEPSRTGRNVAYALGAVGLALGLAATAVYLVADHRYDLWKTEDALLTQEANSLAPDLTARRYANDELLKSVWQLDKVSGALAISSGVLLVTAVIVLIVTRRPSRASQAQARALFHGDSLPLSFEL